MRELVTRLRPQEWGAAGILQIRTYINAQGQVEHHLRGFDLNQPRGEREVDLVFPTALGPEHLVAAHEREVAAHKLPPGTGQRRR